MRPKLVVTTPMLGFQRHYCLLILVECHPLTERDLVLVIVVGLLHEVCAVSIDYVSASYPFIPASLHPCSERLVFSFREALKEVYGKVLRCLVCRLQLLQFALGVVDELRDIAVL